MPARRELLKCLDRLEHDRREFLALLGSEPNGEHTSIAECGRWSIATTIGHLALVEEGMLAYMYHKLRNGMPPKAGFLSGIRLILLLAALRSPLRFKAPSVVIPEQGGDLDGALAKWASARERLREACIQLPDAVLNRALFKHPSAGRFTPAQGLVFVRAHARRHMRQVRASLGPGQQPS